MLENLREKRLLNSVGNDCGVIVDIVQYHGVLCIETDPKTSPRYHSPSSHLGQYWEISRLDTGDKNQITTDEQKAERLKEEFLALAR